MQLYNERASGCRMVENSAYKYNGKSSEMTSKKLGVLIIVQSLDKWRELQPIKVSINRLGKITIA